METLNRTTKFVIALAITTIVNTFLVSQILADGVLLLATSAAYQYSNNPYTYYAILAWPFVAGLAYHALTQDKRVLFPFWVQLATIGISAIILIADSVESPRAISVLYSYQAYVAEFVQLILVTLTLLLVFGGIQALGMRILLGLETRQSPDFESFTVDVPIDNLARLLDDAFVVACALRRKKTDIPDTILLSTRRQTGEEVALAITSKDLTTSVVSLSASDENLLYVTKSDYSKDIMDGLFRSVTERIRSSYPDAKFDPNQTPNDAASIAAKTFSLRKTKTTYNRGRSIFERTRRRISIAFSELHIARAYFGFGFVIVAMMAIVVYLQPPNLVEILVVLILGLLLDFGLPIYQNREERGSVVK